MNRYQYFQTEDFINDEHFIVWVLNPNMETNLFWETWLTENPGQADNVTRARAIVHSIRIKPLPQQLSAQDINVISSHFNKHTAPKKQPLWNNNWLSGAAAVILIAAGIWFWQKLAVQKPTEVAAIKSNRQRIANNGTSARLIRLSDESLVLLRPNSTLDFPSNFGSGNREVALTGEAFFEVHSDPKHPFLVKSGKLLTKVLGTSFDVIATANGNEGSVVVKTGKVRVYHIKLYDAKTQQIDSIILLPNEKVVFNLTTPKLEKIAVKPLMLSPIQAAKEFSFTNAPLNEIISKLQQAYGVEINYDEQKLKSYTITASLSKLPLEEKIRAICKAIDAQYEFQENRINIY